jgi:hypothetical protein
LTAQGGNAKAWSTGALLKEDLRRSARPVAAYDYTCPW